MATVIRPEISEKSRYWISKHRHYELKHFCLQYPIWKSEYVAIGGRLSTSSIDRIPASNVPGDPTASQAMLRLFYAERMTIIEKAALEADPFLHDYILKAVTENLSYTYLKTKMNMPCSRDMYYDRYRRFFWLLSEARK